MDGPAQVPPPSTQTAEEGDIFDMAWADLNTTREPISPSTQPLPLLRPPRRDRKRRKLNEFGEIPLGQGVEGVEGEAGRERYRQG